MVMHRINRNLTVSSPMPPIVAQPPVPQANNNSSPSIRVARVLQQTQGPLFGQFWLD
jgi:hypothetical protein